MNNNVNNPKPVFVNTRVIILILGLITCLLVLLSVISQLLFKPSYPRHIQGLLVFFNSAAEGNLPTYYSSFLLLCSAFLLLVITLGEKKRKTTKVRYWIVLSLGFVYLSIDEMLILHEKVSLFIQSITDYSGEGIFRSTWVIVYSIPVIIVVLFYIKFFIQLDPKILKIFLLAGILYVGAAMGFEILENLYAESYGQDMVYSMMQNLEEGLEMAAIILFIKGLLDYMALNFKLLTFEFKHNPDNH